MHLRLAGLFAVGHGNVGQSQWLALKLTWARYAGYRNTQVGVQVLSYGVCLLYTSDAADDTP